MESEAETDVMEAPVAVQPEPAEPAEPKKKAVKRAPRRDPNEPIPENWQRRLHVADRIDAPKEPFELEDRVLRAENYAVTVGGHVFVDIDARRSAANRGPSEPEPNEPEPSKLEPLDGLLSEWDTGLPAFRIGRVIEVTREHVAVNWLTRACESRPRATPKGPVDSREVYLTNQYATVPVAQVRGECVVQHAQEIRTLARFREKPAQFYFSKYFDAETRTVHDVVPIASLKVWVGAARLETLALEADLAILDRETFVHLQETPRGRKPPNDEAEMPTNLEELARAKNRCPFKYWDLTTRAFAPWPKRMPRVGDEFQCIVDDWPGAPLQYYTWSSPGKAKPVEGDTVDMDRPWAQEMPSGYIPRGGDATSTPLSAPSPGLADFVTTCQQNYAPRLEIPPSNLNFLDACCLAYTQSGEFESAALAVSRLAKQALIPSLSSDELAKFVDCVSPFRAPDWHAAYRAMINKPFQELCLFYFSRMPFADHAPASQMVLASSTKSELDEKAISEPGLRCIECHTQQAPEWHPLPRVLFAVPEPDSEKLALCNRCARLWLRYRTGWCPCSQLNSTEETEPELVDDANSYLAEQERRAKRRQAAAEKKEANDKRKVEEKEVKQATKRLKKEAKARGETPETEEILAKTSEPQAETEDSESKSKTKAKVKEPATKGKEPKTKEPKTKEPKTKEPKTKEPKTKEPKGKEVKGKDTKGKEAKGKEAKNSQREEKSPDDESTEESDSGARKKKGVDTLLSLDLVEDILASLDNDVEPESQGPQPCPVCGQLDPSLPQVACASCMLSVHAACYGANPIDSPWLCDCCQNARGLIPQCDLDYQCLLCPPRAPEYGSWQTGARTKTAPDVLKPTIDRHWCHIRCAIFNPSAQFADQSHLSGISTTNIEAGESAPCRICEEQNDAGYQVNGRTLMPAISCDSENQKSGGELASRVPLSRMGAAVKCELCDDHFHVSCAADRQYFLGLVANNSRAAIVCARHLAPDAEPASFGMTPFSKLDMNLNMTALQWFIAKHKPMRAAERATIPQETGVTGKYRVQAHDKAMVTQLQLGDRPRIVVDEGVALIHTSVPCAKCRSATSGYWHGPLDAMQCSWCFRGYTAGPMFGAEAFWPNFFARAGRLPR